MYPLKNKNNVSTRFDTNLIFGRNYKLNFDFYFIPFSNHSLYFLLCILFSQIEFFFQKIPLYQKKKKKENEVKGTLAKICMHLKKIIFNIIVKIGHDRPQFR